ncbi:MAG: hypothetical protein U0U70_05800 [Chitinophagaceae bacterium]
MYGGEELVNEPLDFQEEPADGTYPPAFGGGQYHVPGSNPEEKRFHACRADCGFLRRYMSDAPRIPLAPVYSAEVWDTYVKFLYYGAEKGTAEPGIRIFNKPGDAYGLTDAAYIRRFSVIKRNSSQVP